MPESAYREGREAEIDPESTSLVDRNKAIARWMPESIASGPAADAMDARIHTRLSRWIPGSIGWVVPWMRWIPGSIGWVVPWMRWIPGSIGWAGLGLVGGGR